MATLKKYNLTGKELEEVKVSDDMLDVSVNQQMLKDYLVAIRANKRQWSACTRGRSEVNHSNAKPHPQKGTGKARQGTLAAPHYKGGGVVFGPKPKFDQHIRINKKERRAAIGYLISEKIKAGKLVVLKSEAMKGPKTKTVSDFLVKIGAKGQRVLFLGETTAETEDAEKAFESMQRQDVFVKSMRNIPRAKFMHATNVSGYDMALEGYVIVFDDAFNDILLMLGA